MCKGEGCPFKNTCDRYTLKSELPIQPCLTKTPYDPIMHYCHMRVPLVEPVTDYKELNRQIHCPLTKEEE